MAVDFCQASRHPVGNPTGHRMKKIIQDVISAIARSSSDQMATRIRPAEEAMARVLVLKRVFDAAPTVVFTAWTSPEQLLHWWGSIRSCTIDARPGGSFRFGVVEGGVERRCSGSFLEVVTGERIVFTSAEEDADGTPGHETLVTVTLIEHEGRTFLTLHQAVFESVAHRDATSAEWSIRLARLAERLR
jgi:uncharacterized protein YndB with AHSA1/START domain